MSQIRPPKLDDQQKAEQAHELLVRLVETHPEIEPTIWAASAFTCIARSFQEADVSYEDFCKEMKIMVEFYKYMWEE